MITCPCGYVAAVDGPSPWSAAWHREHRDQHVASYQGLDEQSIRVLDGLVAAAARRELAAQP